MIQVLPAAVVAPLFFQGKIEFGVINQSSSAFNHILTDVSLVVYQVRAETGRQTDRQIGNRAASAPAPGCSYGRNPRTIVVRTAMKSCIRELLGCRLQTDGTFVD
jgi:hypothetical protein